MSVPVVAIFIVKPGTEELVEQLFRSVIDTTLEEDGCISYQLNRDTENPRRFVWTEEWESKALLERHLNAPHITHLFSVIPQYIETSDIIALNPLAGGAA
ncbi:putative quinol monooxygenase [Siccibacter turicensis]|uniref:putative quinol monooxygenase n=1 Tax=Siccibacter turicensis TaxID=357233 RepID=UPI0023F26104|nr:putative quinol monooxygenase [Siccibacter turicensis]